MLFQMSDSSASCTGDVVDDFVFMQIEPVHPYKIWSGFFRLRQWYPDLYTYPAGLFLRRTGGFLGL